MKLRNPAIIAIIAAGVVLAQAGGVISTVGSALIGIDSGIRAVIDLKTIVAKVIPPPKPKFVPIKPVMIPIMPTKAKVKK
jgi:hypothetical protein